MAEKKELHVWQNLGERLRAHRLHQGLTVDALALKCGLNRRSIIKLEQDERGATWETVCKLAKALGITPNDFLPPVDG